jgi:hypothetical protein
MKKEMKMIVKMIVKMMMMKMVVIKKIQVGKMKMMRNIKKIKRIIEAY